MRFLRLTGWALTVGSIGAGCMALESADPGSGDDSVGSGATGPIPNGGGASNTSDATEWVELAPPGYGGSGNPLVPLPGCADLPATQQVHRVAQDSRSSGAAAYAREALSAFADTPFGLPPAPSGVRAIEVLNAYGLGYAIEDSGFLEATARLDDGGTPSSTEFVLQVALVAPPEVDRRPVHVVFVVDTSVSMSGPSMALQKTLLNEAAASLGVVAGDTVSMVSWTSETRVVLEPKVVEGPGDPALIGAIESLETEGGANLAVGLRTALDLARESGPAGGSKRLVFVTDGATTLDAASIEVLEEMREEDPVTGVGFIGVGVGPGEAYHPVLLRSMVDVSRGAFAFVANESDAVDVFTARFDQLMDYAGYDARLVLDVPGTLIVPDPPPLESDAAEATLASRALAIDGTMVFQVEVTACNPEIFGQSDEAILGSIEYFTADGEMQVVDVGPLLMADIPNAVSNRMARTQALLLYARALEAPTAERVLSAQALLAEKGALEPDLAPLVPLLARHPVLAP